MSRAYDRPTHSAAWDREQEAQLAEEAAAEFSLTGRWIPAQYGAALVAQLELLSARHEARLPLTTETPTMPDTKRYAAIDLHTGYVWGDAEATNACDAAVLVNHKADPRDWLAEEVPSGDARATFEMRVIPETLRIDDGTDPKTVAAVERYPLAGYVRVWDAAGA